MSAVPTNVADPAATNYKRKENHLKIESKSNSFYVLGVFTMCILTHAGLFFASRSNPIIEAYAAAPQIRATIWNSVIGSVPFCAMVKTTY
jgi:hypothetical protein